MIVKMGNLPPKRGENQIFETTLWISRIASIRAKFLKPPPSHLPHPPPIIRFVFVSPPWRLVVPSLPTSRVFASKPTNDDTTRPRGSLRLARLDVYGSSQEGCKELVTNPYVQTIAKAGHLEGEQLAITTVINHWNKSWG